MSSWAPTKYETRNWPSYNAALKQRGTLSIWFDPEMIWEPQPSGTRGLQQRFSGSAVQTCLTLKVLFGMPLRQPTGLVQSLLQSGGLFSRRTRKHCGPKRRLWRKIHIGIDEETLEVRAVEVTTNNVGDAPMLPELLVQTPPDQSVGSVTADGAYDTRISHDAIAARGGHAVIPPRKNAKPWKPTSAGAIARNEAVNASRYLGRAIWRRWSGYHRRSRVESKMNCIKLLGQSLMARDFERQVAEVQVRVAVLNRYTTLGIPVTEPVG
ncbi:IS5 family transposase [Leisingera daeponensis]|uniref:IS5 family transposase n=1 Tax=Leisingera daeponensis TaxID=405746 RepID=UPI001C96EC9B|nr:IS5 family transposase [Leisingera daeponensis]MBY6056804.1 IS5 family transposase [Leisingera daeponensis]